MVWLKNKLTLCLEWIKSKLQSVRLFSCNLLKCSKCSDSTKCLDKLVEKTKIKLRKKVNKRKK